MIPLIKNLVEELHEYTKKKINETHEDIKNELDLIPKVKLYKYMNKSNNNRVNLTQEALEKLINL